MGDLRFRQIHLDFHTSEKIVGIGDAFDPKEFAETLKKAGVNSITCFARCHHGMIYYDTKFPARHPGLKRNLLKEQIEACHQVDIRVPIYITVGWDEYIAARHPEWLERTPEGAPYGAGPLQAGWKKLCFNTPYIDYVVENIGKHETEKVRQTSGNIHDEIEALARQSPIGSHGVFFLPYLMGERSPIWDQNTKGGFIGVTLFNQRSDLFRAAYEGVAYALRSVIDCLEENKLSVQDLTLIGGGAKSPFWNEVMVDVYNKPLKIHKYPGEATSLGTAIAAGVAVGIFEDFRAAARVIQYDRTYTPDPARVEAYEKHYRIYRMLYPALKPVYDEMAAL